MFKPQARDNILTIQDSKEQSSKLNVGLPNVEYSNITQTKCVFYAKEHNSTMGKPESSYSLQYMVY